jgi:hypothetical protein
VRELKVWTHRLTPDGLSAGMAARVRVASQQSGQVRDFPVPDGQIVVPVTGEAATLVITLATGTERDERTH